MKILVVDDEKNIRSVVKEYLENAGYTVEEAKDGEDAYHLLQGNKYNLIVLDIMMPKMDGFTLLKKLNDKDVPVIMLSARGDEYDKLEGFDLGVDDYITKPFSPRELVARCKAILNRANSSEETMYKYKGIEINFLARTVKVDGKYAKLTPKEFEILTYFINNKNIALSREQLLSKLWGYDFFGDDRTVDTHVKMLRHNLGPYRDLIVTVRGIGYRYVEEENE